MVLDNYAITTTKTRVSCRVSARLELVTNSERQIPGTTTVWNSKPNELLWASCSQPLTQ